MQPPPCYLRLLNGTKSKYILSSQTPYLDSSAVTGVMCSYAKASTLCCANFQFMHRFFFFLILNRKAYKLKCVVASYCIEIRYKTYKQNGNMSMCCGLH